jgi:SpoVK/Ycf46/Vps4 family AAA+-type ATPase
METIPAKIKQANPAFCIVVDDNQTLFDLNATLATLKDDGYIIKGWTAAQGIDNQEDTKYNPMAAIEYFKKCKNKTIIIAEDFGMYWKQSDPNIVSLLKDLIRNNMQHHKCFITIQHEESIPKELEDMFEKIEVKRPDKEKRKQFISHTLFHVLESNPERDTIIERLANETGGLTKVNIMKLLAQLFSGGVPDYEALYKTARAERNKVINNTKGLEIFEADFPEFGGYENIKERIQQLKYLKENKHKHARGNKIPEPRGIMLTGIPGCGKTLAAKEASRQAGLPLIKLALADLYESLLGHTEQNWRAARNIIDAYGDCVLLIDELEKGMTTDTFGGGGTSQRLFGDVLNWMQEKKGGSYIIATSNDISKFPPEFLRKGRWDDIFFFDLPNYQEREEIWVNQLRDKEPEQSFNIIDLVEESVGFTGAEIEATIVEALQKKFYTNPEEMITTEELYEVLKNTIPLSKSAADKLEYYRHKMNAGELKSASK